MDRIFKCYQCGKELEFTQLHYLPGQQIYDPISGISYNTGVSYCKKCYDELTTPIGKEDTLNKNNLNSIKDLQTNQKSVCLLVTVVKKEIASY